MAQQAAVDGWFTGRAQWYGSLFTPGAERGPYAASPWRGEKGALWDVGPHALAVLTGVLGEVTALTAAAGPGDTAHLILRHASGASSTADLSFTAPAGRRGRRGVGARRGGPGGRCRAGAARSTRSARRSTRSSKRPAPGCRTLATYGSGRG